MNEIPLKEDQWDGKTYIKTSDLQYRWAYKYIQKLQLRGNEKILDIGCGDGRVTSVIAEAVPNGFVLGVDTSSVLKVSFRRGVKSIVK